MIKLRNKLTTMSVTALLLFTTLGASCDDVAPYLPQADAATVYTNPNPDVEQWHQTALQAGWSESDWFTLSCIIQGESNGWSWVINIGKRDRSYGLMQINTKGSLWYFYRDTMNLSDRSELSDPLINLQAAKVLSDASAQSGWGKHDRWHPWRSASRSRRACFQ